MRGARRSTRPGRHTPRGATPRRRRAVAPLPGSVGSVRVWPPGHTVAVRAIASLVSPGSSAQARPASALRNIPDSSCAGTNDRQRAARRVKGVAYCPRPLMDRDLVLLFATRTIRLAAYGGLAVVLALYLGSIGLTAAAVGLLLTATLAGDAVVSLFLAIRADRNGRRRTLIIGAGLMVLGGIVFALTDQFAILAVAAVIAVLSPSGNEVGPFLSVEQASLSEIVADDRR